MKIIKEGTITIRPDAMVIARDFACEDGTFAEMEHEIEERVLRAARLITAGRLARAENVSENEDRPALESTP